MTYRVDLTEEAEKDLLDIHGYVAAYEDPAKVDELLNRLEATYGKWRHPSPQTP